MLHNEGKNKAFGQVIALNTVIQKKQKKVIAKKKKEEKADDVKKCFQIQCTLLERG